MVPDTNGRKDSRDVNSEDQVNGEGKIEQRIWTGRSEQSVQTRGTLMKIPLYNGGGKSSSGANHQF
jgi:hypothetical protein